MSTLVNLSGGVESAQGAGRGWCLALRIRQRQQGAQHATKCPPTVCCARCTAPTAQPSIATQAGNRHSLDMAAAGMGGRGRG